MQPFFTASKNTRISVCAGYFKGDILFEVDGLTGECGAVPDYVANSFAILTRGAPTRPTPQLLSLMNCQWEELAKSALLLSTENHPYWGATIPGGDDGYNPALEFFDEIIPNHLKGWAFVRGLMVPEYPLFSALGASYKLMSGANAERVDFYLPQAELVIEIDGGQHEEAPQKLKDQQRDSFLLQHGIKTLRLKTEDMRLKSNHFSDFISQLTAHFEKSKQLAGYKKTLSSGEQQQPSMRYELTAILRLQIAVMLAISCGKLDLQSSLWRINVRQDFISDPEQKWVVRAFEELFGWFSLFSKIRNLVFTPPELVFVDDGLLFNMQLFSRPDDNAGNTPGITIYTSAVQSHSFSIGGQSVAKLIRLRCSGKSYLSAENPQQRFVGLYPVECLNELNYRIFGHSSFRPGQETLILNALTGQKSLGLMPTGGGKSLCFQIPALLNQGVTIVVVPIKALGRDHCAELENAGFFGRVVNIDSDMPAALRDKIYQERILSGDMRFVFVSPERFQTDGFRRIVMNLRQAHLLRMFVIDEVHCMSEWGHDFRPSYLTLPGTLRKIAGDIPVLGLTATASVNVLKDIQNEFQIADEFIAYEMHRSRTELNFSIYKGDNSASAVIKQIDKIAPRNSDEPLPAVHVFSRYASGDNGVELLSQGLAKKRNDLKIGFFSGSMPKSFNPEKAWKILQDKPLAMSNDYEQYKQVVQSRWKKGQLDIIVTTKAFGMGVNKSDVRHTLHVGMPGSMEAFYQEAGRAGRDRCPSHCHMLFRAETDEAEQIWLKLQSNLTPEAVENELSSGGKVSRGDFRSQLWFLRQGLISLADEQDLVTRLHGIIRDSKKDNLTVHVKNVCGDSHNGLRFQLTLFRLYQMGLIEPWTVIDWGRGQGEELSVQAVEVRRLKTSFSKACGAVKARIQSIDGRAAESVVIDKLNVLAKETENWPGLYSLLLDWVRRTQLGSRLQSTWNLYNACLKYTPEQAIAFRDTLESFFKVDNNAFQLASLRDMTLAESAEALCSLITSKESEALLDASILRKLSAQLARLLEGTQESPGLNLAAACLQLLNETDSDTETRMRFQQAVPEGVLHFWEEDGHTLLAKVAASNAYARETVARWLLEANPTRHQLLSIHKELPVAAIKSALFRDVADELAQII
ncbi:DEAD/DEAH box helicase [Cedecea neteri]|uniref:DNA 3'-5' helicase n=1 Tax=Cedecea neteri TaxID=158822 RepID=A0A291DYG3_9ENTR|nr:DEAD/DEAH box helicase [Cedecea neteri]ATF92763.1 hypothetical protein CO704_11970 [Cedecea neteri]